MDDLQFLSFPIKPPLDRFPDLFGLDREDEDSKRDEEEPVSASALGFLYGTEEPLEEAGMRKAKRSINRKAKA